MSTFSCFEHDRAAFSNGLELHTLEVHRIRPQLGKWRSGFIRKRGHFGIIICDTQN